MRPNNFRDNSDRRDTLLPPAELLERYESIYPDSTKELMDMARKEQKHRHSLQRKYLMQFRLGQLFGVIFTGYILFEIFRMLKMGMYVQGYVTLFVFAILIMQIIRVYRSDRNGGFRKKKPFRNGGYGPKKTPYRGKQKFEKR